jgi:hypothetical protein
MTSRNLTRNQYGLAGSMSGDEGEMRILDWQGSQPRLFQARAVLLAFFS